MHFLLSLDSKLPAFVIFLYPVCITSLWPEYTLSEVAIFESCTIQFFSDYKSIHTIEFDFKASAFLHHKIHKFEELQEQVVKLSKKWLQSVLSQRYQNVCVVYLPVIPFVKYVNILQQFYAAFSVLGKTVPMNIPEFVVLYKNLDQDAKPSVCTHTTNLNFTGLKLEGNVDLSFKVIMIDRTCKDTISIPCIHCPANDNEAAAYPVTNISTLPQLIITWFSFNSDYNLHISYSRKCDIFYGKNHWRPNWRYNYLGVNEEDLCIIDISLEQVNCSICSHWGNVGHLLKRGWGIQASIKGKQIMTFGSTFQGFKYTVFVHRDEIKSSSDVAFLTKAFSRLEWIFTLSSGFAVVFAIWITEVKFKTSLEFVVATFLEQVDVPTKYLNKANILVITAWIFATMLIRNIFTTKMFNALTAESTPKSMPTSIRDLIRNNPMQIAGSRPFLEALATSNMLNDVQYSSLAEDFHLLEKRIVTFLYTEYGAMSTALGREAVKNISAVNKVVCLHLNRTEILQNVGENHLESQELDVREHAFSKFALVHETVPMGNVFMSFYYQLASLELFGNSKSYRNHEPEILSDIRLWYVKEKSLVGILLEPLLARVYESGIVQRIEFFYRSKFQSKVTEEYRSFNKGIWAQMSHLSFAHSRMSGSKSKFEHLDPQKGPGIAKFTSLKAAFLLYILNIALSCFSFMLERCKLRCCLLG